MTGLLDEHDPRAVANYFIKKFKGSKARLEFSLNPIVLENMVYLANLAHIYCFKMHLLDSEVLSGKYKDYNPQLQEALKDVANHEVPELITGMVDQRDTRTKKVVMQVIESKFSRPQLMILDQIYKAVSERNFKHTNFPYLYKLKESSLKQELSKPVQRDVHNLQRYVTENMQSLVSDEAA